MLSKYIVCGFVCLVWFNILHVVLEQEYEFRMLLMCRCRGICIKAC